MALNRHSNALGYVHDMLLSIRRNVGTLLPGAPEALDSLAAIYRGSAETVDLAAVVRDATPPVRLPSEFQVIDRSGSDRVEGVERAERGTPDLVKVVTPRGGFAFCFPSFESGAWVRLPGEIEPRMLDQLLRADGFPIRGRDIEALRDCRRPWMKVVWIVNDMAPAPRGGEPSPLIECCGQPSRRRGQKRKLDPNDERPDDRAFFIRPHRWDVAPNVSAQTLDNVEALVLERFGEPARGASPPEESPGARRSCRTP